MNAQHHDQQFSQSAFYVPKVASLSARKWMRNIALTELILSIVAFCLGSTCTGINLNSDRLTCVYGTGIWVGILCAGRAIFGLIALNPMLHGKHRILSAYFVLCFVSTVASCILAAISSMWVQRANQYWQKDNAEVHLASYVLNVLLLILALLHIVFCAISTGIMLCYYFGCHAAVYHGRPRLRMSEMLTTQNVATVDSHGRQVLVCFDNNPTVIAPSAPTASSNSLNRCEPPPAYEDKVQKQPNETDANIDVKKTSSSTSV